MFWWVMLALVIAAIVAFVVFCYREDKANQAMEEKIKKQGWHYVKSCGPSRFVVSKGNGKKGLVDEQGRMILECQYEAIYFDYKLERWVCIDKRQNPKKWSEWKEYTTYYSADGTPFPIEMTGKWWYNKDGGYIEFEEKWKKGFCSADGSFKTTAVYERLSFYKKEKVLVCMTGFGLTSDYASKNERVDIFSTENWKKIGSCYGVFDVIVRGKAIIRTSDVSSTEIDVTTGAEEAKMDNICKVCIAGNLLAVEVVNGIWTIYPNDRSIQLFTHDGETCTTDFYVRGNGMEVIMPERGSLKNEWDYATVKNGRLHVFKSKDSILGGWYEYGISHEGNSSVCYIANQWVTYSLE